MNDEQLKNLGKEIVEYCKKYSIPLQYFFDILNDQKVNPMMRGKGMEYQIFLLLASLLNPSEWIVQKLNLNPQPNMPDVDIGVTHRRTGEIIKVESKPAVRGSIKSGARSRIYKAPYFQVKCHRSRSNIKRAQSSNDRYEVDIFDIVITNPSNAIIKGKTIGPELELIQDENLLKILFKYYSVEKGEKLIECVQNDWRFVLPSKISVGGFVPRTPYVLLENDPNWLPIDQVEANMLEIVKGRRLRK